VWEFTLKSGYPKFAARLPCKITDPGDPEQLYEVVTQETIRTLCRITLAAFDMPPHVQRQQYELATSTFEMWIATVGDQTVAADRAYLELLVEENPIAHADAPRQSPAPVASSKS